MSLCDAATSQCCEPKHVHARALASYLLTFAVGSTGLHAWAVQVGLSAFYNLEGGIDVPILFSDRLSSSMNFQVHAHEVTEFASEYVSSNAECLSYEMQYATGGVDAPPFTDHFLRAVATTPSVVGNASDLVAQLTFLREFGNQVVVGADFGSRATLTYHLKHTAVTAAVQGSVDVHKASSHSAFIFWGHSESEDAAADVSAVRGLDSVSADVAFKCTPLCPPRSVNASTNTSQWQQDVFPIANGSAGPVAYRVVPLTAVLQPRFFPTNLSAHVAQLSASLAARMADGSYCRSMPLCANATARTPSWAVQPLQLLRNRTTETTVAVANDVLYLTGGMAAGVAALAQTRATNLTVGQPSRAAAWEYTGRMAQPLMGGAVSVTNATHWMVVGGVLANGTRSAGLHAMDLSTRAWVAGPALDVPLAMAHGAFLPQLPAAGNGTVVVLGGVRGDGTVACAARVWHVGAQSWTTGKPSRVCVHSAGVFAAAPTAVYAFGGTRADGTCSALVAEYDTVADAWSTVATLPAAACDTHAAPVNATHAVVVAPGAFVVLWDATARTFHLLPPAPVSLASTASAYHPAGDALYVVGGGYLSVLRDVTGALRAPAPPTPTPPRYLLQDTGRSAPPTVWDTGRGAPAHSNVSEANTLPFPLVHLVTYGYGPVRGDPFHASGIDPGFARAPIFDVTPVSQWQNPMDIPLDNTKWLLPSGVDGQYQTEDACAYWQQSEVVRDAASFRTAAAGVRTLLPSKKWGWPAFFGYEYSAGETSSLAARASAELNGTLLVSLGVCLHNDLQVAPSAPGLAFTPAFVADLACLPATANATTAPQLLAFVDRYGAYVPSRISLGALVAQLSVVADAHLEGLVQGGVDVAAAAEASFLGFLAQARADAGGSVTAQMVADLRAAMSRNATVCLPSCPPLGPTHVSDPSAWYEQLAMPHNRVAPVALELQPIVDMLDASRSKLPVGMQGGLDQQLAALSTFMARDYCGLVPGCVASDATPTWSLMVPPPHIEPGQLRAAVKRASGVVLEDGTVLVMGGATTDATPVALNTTTVCVTQRQFV